MPNIQLANNLRYLRKQHKLTQTNLSKMLNISRQAYSNYETSKRTPDLDSILCLSRFYHVSLNDLVLGNLKDDAFAMDKKTGNTIYLTNEEMDIITQFRALSKENKQIITGFLHSNSKNAD